MEKKLTYCADFPILSFVVGLYNDCVVKHEKPETLTARTALRLNGIRPGLASNGLIRIAVFGIVFAFYSIFARNFFSVITQLNLLTQTSPLIILAIGETLVLLVGGIDLSVGAMTVFGGVALVVFLQAGMPTLEAMVWACLVCSVIGLANGFLVARLRLPSFIITFAMAMLIPVVSKYFQDFMGYRPDGLNSLNELPRIFRIITTDASGAETVRFPGVSLAILIMVFLAVLSHLFLGKTRYGRQVYLVGSNPVAAHLSGITTLYHSKALIDGKAESKPRIVIILKSVDYRLAFWQTVKDGVESASKDDDVQYTILGPFSETQVDEQIQIVQNAIRSKPDAIVLAATDYDRLVPVAKEVKKAHIPLITLDSFINSQDTDVRIGTDNYDAGQKAGAALMEHISLGSQVVIMSYIQGSSTAMDRESGVRDYLKSKVNILETIYSNGEADIAYKQALDLLRNKPDVKGIIALNDPTAIGAARAMNESGRKDDVTLIGFDNSLDVLQSVEAGIIKDTIVQRPFNMGYLSITAAIDIIGGKKVEAFIDTGSKDINRQNMLLPENQKLLFPVNR